jgi:hypothetical protein
MENVGRVSNLTFLDTSALLLSASDRRGPRPRAAPPVPVPNLTKKSRGRRVPTKIPPSNGDSVALDGSTPSVASRVYVCKVENCGKCFNRGEHLKRHIRSIHTYEKRELSYSLLRCDVGLTMNQLSNANMPVAASSSTDTTIFCSISKFTKSAMPPTTQTRARDHKFRLPIHHLFNCISNLTFLTLLAFGLRLIQSHHLDSPTIATTPLRQNPNLDPLAQVALLPLTWRYRPYEPNFPIHL